MHAMHQRRTKFSALHAQSKPSKQSLVARGLAANEERAQKRIQGKNPTKSDEKGRPNYVFYNSSDSDADQVYSMNKKLDRCTSLLKHIMEEDEQTERKIAHMPNLKSKCVQLKKSGLKNDKKKFVKIVLPNTVERPKTARKVPFQGHNKTKMVTSTPTAVTSKVSKSKKKKEDELKEEIAQIEMEKSLLQDQYSHLLKQHLLTPNRIESSLPSDRTYISQEPTQGRTASLTEDSCVSTTATPQPSNDLASSLLFKELEKTISGISEKLSFPGALETESKIDALKWLSPQGINSGLHHEESNSNNHSIFSDNDKKEQILDRSLKQRTVAWADLATTEPPPTTSIKVSAIPNTYPPSSSEGSVILSTRSGDEEEATLLAEDQLEDDILRDSLEFNNLRSDGLVNREDSDERISNNRSYADVDEISRLEINHSVSVDNGATGKMNGLKTVRFEENKEILIDSVSESSEAENDGEAGDEKEIKAEWDELRLFDGDVEARNESKVETNFVEERNKSKSPLLHNQSKEVDCKRNTNHCGEKEELKKNVKETRETVPAVAQWKRPKFNSTASDIKVKNMKGIGHEKTVKQNRRKSERIESSSDQERAQKENGGDDLGNAAKEFYQSPENAKRKPIFDVVSQLAMMQDSGDKPWNARAARADLHGIKPGYAATQITALSYLFKELMGLMSDRMNSEESRLLNEIDHMISLLPFLINNLNPDLQTEINLAVQPLRVENSDLRRQLRIVNQKVRDFEIQTKQLKESLINAKKYSLNQFQFEKLRAQMQQDEIEKKMLVEKIAGLSKDLEGLKTENQRLMKQISEMDANIVRQKQLWQKEKTSIFAENDVTGSKLESLSLALQAQEKANRILKLSLSQSEAEVVRLNDLNRDLRESVAKLLRDVNFQDIRSRDKHISNKYFQDEKLTGPLSNQQNIQTKAKLFGVVYNERKQSEDLIRRTVLGEVQPAKISTYFRQKSNVEPDGLNLDKRTLQPPITSQQDKLLASEPQNDTLSSATITDSENTISTINENNPLHHDTFGSNFDDQFSTLTCDSGEFRTNMANLSSNIKKMQDSLFNAKRVGNL